MSRSIDHLIPKTFASALFPVRLNSDEFSEPKAERTEGEFDVHLVMLVSVLQYSLHLISEFNGLFGGVETVQIVINVEIVFDCTYRSLASITKVKCCLQQCFYGDEGWRPVTERETVHLLDADLDVAFSFP